MKKEREKERRKEMKNEGKKNALERHNMCRGSTFGQGVWGYAIISITRMTTSLKESSKSDEH